jgi:hypothetical protein
MARALPKVVVVHRWQPSGECSAGSIPVAFEAVQGGLRFGDIE